MPQVSVRVWCAQLMRVMRAVCVVVGMLRAGSCREPGRRALTKWFIVDIACFVRGVRVQVCAWTIPVMLVLCGHEQA